MDMKLKHRKGQPSSGVLLKKRFYEEAVHLTGFPEGKCREILVADFGATFDADKIPEYLERLKECATEARQIEALNRKRQALRSRIHPVPTPDPCMITGCAGIKVADSIWQWTCSEGGFRHYLAVTGARLAKCTPDEMLTRLDMLSTASNLRRATELEHWKEGMQKPYEQAWSIIETHVEVSYSSGAFTQENA